MRVTILNQFYLPDISPTAQLAGSLAEHRAAQGDRVTVVAGSALYAPHADGSRPNTDRGVRVYRIPTPGFGKKVTILRALDYLTFFLLAILRIATLPRQDVIITMTTPPYVVLLGVLHKFLHRRTKLVLWVMDCYPEVPEMSGMLRPRSLPSRLLRKLNRFVFRRLDHLVCLDGAMANLLLSQYAPRRGLPATTIIPNWERLDLFPANASYPKWAGIEQHGLAGKFVVVYLGNAGVGHEFGTFIDVATQLKDEPFAFVFIGAGSRWKELVAAKDAKPLPNLVMMGYVPKEQTGAVMASCDLALITLRNDAAGLISPSKMHSNLALGLPILYIGPRGSNVDEAIERHAVGVSVRAGDAATAVAFLRRVHADAAFRAELRQHARTAFDGFYNDRQTLPQFDRVLDTLAAPSRPTSEVRG